MNFLGRLLQFLALSLINFVCCVVVPSDGFESILPIFIIIEVIILACIIYSITNKED